MKKELPRYTIEARARLFGDDSSAARALREADSRAMAGEVVSFFAVGDSILVEPRTSSPSSKRHSGYYRVKVDGEWAIAKYDARFDQWESMGEGGYSADDSWEEIDPNRIAMPGDDALDPAPSFP